MYSVLLHDERLDGNTPDWDDTTCFTVEAADPIERVLGWVNACYQQGGAIEDLSIMCHGFTSSVNGKGGHGLQLSKDGVYLTNVNKWTAIQGKVKWIVVFACNAAEVDLTVAAGTSGDGRALCRKLASTTGATVLAAVRTQVYFVNKMKFRSIKPWKWRREIDFDDFEGPVYSFRPDGTVTNVSPWLGDS
jgi:hypothetical protein